MELPKTRFEKAIKYLPDDIKKVIDSLDDKAKGQIQEIRLRVNQPVTFTINGKSTIEKRANRILTLSELDEIFNRICDYSLHTYQEEINNGFITVDGGHRIGFCGTKTENTIKNITSINIRIASEIFDCGFETAKLFKAHNKGILLAGPPLSGKTTIIRDITRIIGNTYKVAVIDERNEISATYNGKAQNEIGKYTDVLNGYKKEQGIEIATRVLSPDVIICDEIGSKKDINEILASANSGVKFIASIHAENLDDLMNKKHLRKLFDNNIFGYIVILDTEENIGMIKQIVNTEDFVYENNRNVYGSNLRLSYGKYVCR